MKYQKLVNEINFLLGSVTKEREKQRKKLKYHLRQVKAEEQKLRKKLEKENCGASRKKLKRELSSVKKAYVLLDA
ncbi:MAG: hypothetical protein KZQ97_17800 [Candidatus Thiodiazotropha sp. (ex Dulcina madagascariensis)]|nr:hypothetical protein [Candidatus Thiodiazotropha sp. (ex Dulcina madagascariensis)]